MSKFVFDFAEWENVCKERGYDITHCHCNDVCKGRENCLNGKSVAITNDGRIGSIFRFFSHYGAFYD